MILVAGATGYLGGDICERLAANGERVRALLRRTSDPAAVARLKKLGAECVEGDLRDRASLAAACRGAWAVVSTVTTTRSAQPGDGLEATDLQGQLNLVEAARTAGVGHFVYVSFSGNIDRDEECALGQAKRTVEKRLRESGIAHAVLRPSYLMQTWLGPFTGFDYENAKVTIYGEGRNKISWIARPDVAQFAALSLDNPAAANATLELGGPEELSPLEAVRIFEEVSGKPFEVQHVPVEALRAQQAGAADSMAKTFATLQLSYAAGDRVPMKEVLRTYPVSLTTVREYAQEMLPVLA